MTSKTRLFVCFTLVATFASAIGQKAPRPKPQPKSPPVATKDATPTAETPEVKPSPYRPYKEIITKEAVTQTGLFKVHRIEDRIFFEIPNDKLGRAMLWQTEVAQLGATSPGYPGSNLGTRVVRFTRRNNKVFLRAVDFGVRSAVDGATKLGVQANTVDPILMSFEVQTEGEGKTPVIDVTPLFTTDPPDFSAKEAVGGAGADPSRSYVEHVKAFPANIETRSFITYIVGGSQFFGGGGPSSTTALVHYSLDLLPETPMAGRLKDSRIGYFTQGFTEYGRPENRAVAREFINRFRLEKKDPSAAISEPVQPITFYLSREVPEKWRPYLKAAVEAWKPAFEQAGFKNAIRCLDAPTDQQDPEWDSEDARYSVIRWAASTTENAMGPSIQDPRSGETLSAHIIVWNNVMQLAEDWYFSQCAAVDREAQKLPLPDSLMGRLLTFIVTHEVGHTLGLEHNFKASAFYTIAQLRDPSFVAHNGLAASVMDYSRFNYVAQPGDGAKTIGCLGPYDLFAIEYGYKPIPSTKTPDDEKPALDALLSKQVEHPELRFGNYRYAGIDPTTQTEDIGDDALAATKLGLENIDRIAKTILIPATEKLGSDYSLLGEMHGQLVEQRFIEIMHVLSLVGGVVETDYHAGRGGDVFTPVSAERQASAVKFLTQYLFAGPGPLYSKEILSKIAPTGGFDAGLNWPKASLTLLLSEARLRRIADSQNTNGAKSYGLSQLVSDLSDGVWAPLMEAKPTLDAFHRSLQRAYLKTIDSRINGASATQTDLKPLELGDLAHVRRLIDKTLPRVKDELTLLHLTQCRHDIDNILINRYAVAASSGPSLFEMMFGVTDKRTQAQSGCFSEASRIPDWVRVELEKARE